MSIDSTSFFITCRYSLMLELTSKAHMGMTAYKIIQHCTALKKPLTRRHYTNALLAISNYSLHANLAEEILNLMKANGKAPNRMNYECVMSVFIKAGNMKKAEELFQEMIDHHIDPTVWTYNLLLNGCLKTNNCDRGLELFTEMQSRNIKPDTISCNTMIKIMGENNKYNMMEMLLNQMSQFEIPIDIITYNTLIGMYCRKGDVKKAFSLFYSIPPTLSPDIKTYNTLISGCSHIQDLDTAKNVYHQIIAKGLLPNVFMTLFCS